MADHLFTVDPWVLREDSFDADTLAVRETLFTLGNGSLGIRGCHEESEAAWWRGSYVNGFYESRPIVYGERAYGFADRYQTILNCTDACQVRLSFQDEHFSPEHAAMENYSRELDLRTGVLKRVLDWLPARTPGTRIRVESERIVPYRERSLMMMRYRVTLLEGTGTVRILHHLDGDVSNLAAGEDPRTGSHIMPGDFGLESLEMKEECRVFHHFTRMSGLRLCFADMDRYRSVQASEPVTEEGAEGKSAFSSSSAELTGGGSLELLASASWVHGMVGEETELEKRALGLVHGSFDKGFDKAVEEQKEFLREFWQEADVLIDGDPEVQQSIRFNLFHLLQGAGRGGSTSLPAKGLTGEGYEGHYFWDTEIYALPFFLYTRPEIAGDLLEYRYRTLSFARGRAAQLNRRGALYPWRTINGNEASAFFPAGTAQYHINADIAYAVVRYLEVSGDETFLAKGTEILVETARFWHDLGDYIPGMDNAFCINCVTGPDEYTALVNNNYYTNIMARENLRTAAHWLEKLREKDEAAWIELAGRVALAEDEPEQWRRAAEAMYLPLDSRLGVHPQDDSFLNKARWEAADIPESKRPLLMHFHPLTIYRYQVLKQADLVLAEMLLGHHFSRAQKKRDFDYYDPLTTADSSLSPCIQGVMAAELGYKESSYRHFMRSVRMDLDDVNGNVRDGVHTAAMAGSWISLVYGFAGFRDNGGVFSFSPSLPDAWNRLTFSLRRGDAALEVTIGHEEAAYYLKRGSELTIIHCGEKHRVCCGTPLVLSLRPELEAVIFDLDGVITDSAEYHYLAWKQLCDELDIPFDRDFNHKLKGVSRMASLDLLLSRTEKEFNSEEKIEMATRKNNYYKELIKRIGPGDLLPGIDSLLTELKEVGILVALASASRNAPAILDYLQVRDRFDAITDPASLCKGKPDPEQFFLAAEMLGVPYRNCIGVEDAQAGIDAINDAGMLSVGIGDYLEGASLRLSSTAKLSLEKLRELFYR